jgi:hypothetical protein
MNARILVGILLLTSTTLWGQFDCQTTKLAPVALQSTVPLDYNSRSDTADLVSLKLSIDTRKFSSKQLQGKAEYQIGAKLAFTKLRFDLLGYTVDSVVAPSGALSFSQQGEFLTVHQAATQGSILHWTIYYSGTTTKDGSGWGGMHHDGAYHYNLGVGFAANPHVYGRSLFPCFDNFVEKTTLKEMNITTPAGKVGVSNGLLQSVDTLTTGDLVWHWEGQAPLPSYLVSLAVSDYFKHSWTHDGKTFETYGRAQDTANMRAGFVHLNDMYDAFVDEFGPYRFEKVGYALTITGAMEHAGMIHLPRTLANAALQGEDIIAHELAHMWFGNAVTTKTAEDMWINEGFAEFGSHFYEEKVYGRAQYVTTVQRNQVVVLKSAAQNDGGHLALSGVNQDQTYGTHTYQKGAMVAHNLREFLGDSLFSVGVKHLIASNTFGNYDFLTFKAAFETGTGVNLDTFWNDWITSPGYHGASVYIDQNSTSAASAVKPVVIVPLRSNVPPSSLATGHSTPVHVYKHSPNYGYQGIVDLGHLGDYTPNASNGTAHSASIDLGSGTYWTSVNDSAESLGTSVYDTFTWSELSGTKTLPNTGIKVTPKPNTAEMNGQFYVWHHRTEGMYTGEYWVSPHHFYFIGYEGSHDPPLAQATSLPFEVTLRYNTNQTQGGLDYNLKGFEGDSMTVVRLPGSDVFYGTPVPGTANQTVGNFGVGNLTFTPDRLFAHYRIGNLVPLKQDEKELDQIKIYPNPSKGVLKIEGIEDNGAEVQIYDASGRRQLSSMLNQDEGIKTLDISHLSPGSYIFSYKTWQASFQIVK